MYILKTRLHKPKLKEDYIYRDSVINYLDKQIDTPLKLVIAGAGYGKSITVSQWLDHREGKNSWVSLERDCNDLRLFLKYLIRAIQQAYPASLSSLGSMLEANELPETAIMAADFVNEMIELDEEFNLVLDDYHLIKNPQIHDFINEILKFPLDNLKLFILSRTDPPLKLNTLKAYDQVTEIRMANLKFTTPEILALSDKSYNLNIERALAEKICYDTEGWIIGIRLLLKELINKKILSDTKIHSYVGKDNLVNFLQEEIMQEQVPSFQSVIIQASLFDRFNLDLILKINKEAVEIGIKTEEAIQAFYRFIEQSMFIVSLDDEKVWFRFHHLIQESLQGLAVERFSKEQITVFHQIGSVYFESCGFLLEAIYYAVKGDDLEGAIAIIDRHRLEIQDRDQAVELKAMLDILPVGTIEKSPSLLLARAFVLETLSQFDAEQKDLDNAFELMQPEPRHHSEASALLWGEYYEMQGVLYFYFGKINESFECTGKSLALVKNELLFVRDYVVSMHSLTLQVLGRRKEALETYHHFLDVTPKTESRCIARLHSYHCVLCMWNGDLAAALESANIAFDLSKKEQIWNSLILGAYFKSGVHYLQNEPEHSITAASGLTNYQYSGRPGFVVHAYTHKILSLCIQGEYEKVGNSLSELRNFVKVFNRPEIAELVIDIEIEAALRNDDMARAEELHVQATYNPHPLVYSFYYPQLTQVKLLMTEGRFKDMDKARMFLEEYVNIGEQSANADLLIQLYTLKSLWLKRSDQLEEAIEFLLKSLNLAHKGKFLRPYLDLGLELKELLQQLPGSARKKGFIQHILMAFEHEIQKKTNLTTLSPSKYQNGLTSKEIAILELIAKGNQNKEIANELNFSLNTIKKYVHIIYEKLNVKNRAEAISRLNDMINSSGR